MATAECRERRGNVQVCIEVPLPLRKQADEALRRLRIGLSPWVRQQMQELVADHLERQAWELRQEAAGVATE